ncbi:Thymidylate kinase [Acidibacillus sp. S0AB]|uniref:Thymidylate kinase n=2 Tax=Sulfoacidibacillus ferrooxidans TaxID=2005001 RepID=A0A9X1V7H6_9BACL|nr:Thymidylate kinase [Sulfoacidibacillus ferrooxidans]
MDGSGKTTQVEQLCSRLLNDGIDHIRTREPGGTPVGDAIRSLLLDPKSTMTPITEVYLYAAARAEHVQRVIIPALQSGQVVVCDRFVDASIVYQGYGLASSLVTPELVQTVNQVALQEITPDLTIVLDVAPELAEKRLLLRSGAVNKDRIELRGIEFFSRVREGLRKIYEQEPSRIQWIDATESPVVVEQKVWHLVSQLINRVEGSPCN